MEFETALSSDIPDQTFCGAAEDRWSQYQDNPLSVEKFFSGRRGNTLILPEERLMFAILEDALDCFQQHCAAKHGKRGRLFQTVEIWFFAPSGGWIFDFESICSVLGFDPDYVRKGLVQWKERQLSKTSRASPFKTAPQPARRTG